MSLTASGHAIGTNPLASDGPYTVFGWFNPGNVGQSKRFFQIGNSGDDNQFNLIGTDRTAASGQAIAATYQSSSSGTQTKGAALSVGTWYFLGATFAANGQPGIVVNQNAKTVGGTGFNPTINQTLVNGQPSNFGNGAGGQFAHLGGVTRILADLELSYLGGGGNPQWFDFARYWKCAATETSTITDIAGHENLTCTSITAGTTDPPNGIASFWPGAGLSAQTGTQGSALTSIDWTTKFDKTAASVDYTVKLYTRSGPGTATTATAAAATNANLVTVADATNFAAGGYASITTNSDPLLILAKSGNTLLLGGFRTWALNANVYPFTVTQKTFTFYSSGNTFSGTPAAGDVGTYTLIPRAANNTTATLIADGPAFQLTIAASGAAPSFSAGPTLTNPTTDGYVFGGTSNQTATWYAVAMVKGSTAPTGAQVKSGSPTGFIARVNVALTAATPGTLTFTGLTRPVHDLYHVVDNGSGTSAVSSFTDQLITPASTKQFVRATVVSVSAVSKANPCQITTSGAHGRTTGDFIDVYDLGGMTELNTAFAAASQKCTVVDSTHLTVPIDSTGFTTYTSGGSLAWGASIDKGASTAIASGDVRILDLVTAPDGCAVTCRPDGAISIAMGNVTRRQSFVADAYSVSADAVLGSASFYFQNLPPNVSSVAGTVLPPVILPANQSITPVSIATLATSPEADSLSVGSSGLPAGLSISSGNLVGTTGANAITPVTFTWTDAAGESASAQYNLVIGQVTPPNLFGLTQDTIVSLLASFYLSASFGSQDNTAGVGGAAAAAGTAIAQSPPVGTPVAPNSTINVSLSTGNTPVVITPPTPTGVKSAQIQYEESVGTVNTYRTDEIFGQLVLGAGDPAGQVYRIGRIAAAARVTSLEVQNDPNGSGSLYRIGVALPNSGGLVVTGSDSIFVPSLSLDSQRSTWAQVLSAAVVGQPSSLANVGKRVWELLGLPQDPSPANKDLYYDVILTAVSPGASGGAINVRVSGRLITSLRVP